MNMHAVRYLNEDEQAYETPSTQPDPVNILVVDDLPEKILVYKTILEDLNQNLIFAQSGEEALKLVLKNEFAVILLDVNMPTMDGFETATLIRGRKKSSKTPIIFLTAFNDEMNVAQGYASGAVDYLPTPVVPEVLKAKIRVFIELFQMRQQAAHQAEERAKRKAAEESARRKDEFLATLAHELRNPLAPIRNAIQLLQSPNLKPDMIASALQIMDRQLHHMVRLVDDLMDVSRITRGKIDLKLEPLPLQKAIENAIETARPLIEERKHNLKLEIPAEPIMINADGVRISQIFANLLNNAAKYTDSGGDIKIKIDQEHDMACVYVIDTGVGLEKEKINRIFDIFMQVDSSMTRSQGGLGIGLTLVRNLLEMQNGMIEAFSEGLHKGSTFLVKIPVMSKKIEEIAQKPLQKITDTEKQKICKILIVDDNEASAKTLGWMLELLGHDISLAFNGAEAIEKAKTYLPDVVLLDIGLPHMNGYEVCEIMLEQPGLEKTIFVAQTGWGQEEHRRRSKEVGFHHHLVKPIRSESLENIISSIGKQSATSNHS